MGQLYQFIDRQQNAFFDKSLLIPSPSQTQSYEFNYSQIPNFFYSFQNSTSYTTKIPINLQNQNIILFSQILNLLLFPIRTYNWYSSQTFYTNVFDNQFYSKYPITYFDESYKPHQRIWYYSHLESVQKYNKHFTITDPYINFQNGVSSASITYSLLNNNFELEGVVSTDYTVLHLSSFQSYSFMNIALVNLLGEMIAVDIALLQYAIKNDTTYIYDVQLTGFNQEDWNQIQLQFHYQNGTSNCEQSLNKFCRYNRMFQSNSYITIYLIKNKYYLMTFSAIEYMQTINSLTEKVSTDISSIINIYIILFASVASGFLALSYLAIQFFLKPYNKIQTFLKIQLNPFKSEKNQMIFQNSKINPYSDKNQNSSIKSTFFKKVGLKRFYEKIQNQKPSKSQECINLELFQYPQKIDQLQVLEDNYILLLDQIINYNDQCWNLNPQYWQQIIKIITTKSKEK